MTDINKATLSLVLSWVFVMGLFVWLVWGMQHGN